MSFGVRKSVGLCFLAIVLTASAGVLEQPRFMQRIARHKFNRAASDTVSAHRRTSSEVGIRHKMSSSIYPVQLQVTRNSIKIHSDHSQILPIYRQNGTFYMVMRLNKGVNWLNGLPRGRYFINNRPIAIN